MYNQSHAAPFAINANNMEFTTDLEPDIVGCDRFEQIIQLVSKCKIKSNLFTDVSYKLMFVPFYCLFFHTARGQTNRAGKTSNVISH